MLFLSFVCFRIERLTNDSLLHKKFLHYTKKEEKKTLCMEWCVYVRDFLSVVSAVGCCCWTFFFLLTSSLYMFCVLLFCSFVFSITNNFFYTCIGACCCSISHHLTCVGFMYFSHHLKQTVYVDDGL